MILLIAEQIFDNPNNSSQKFPPFLSRLPHPVSFITFLGYHVGIASNNRGELIFMNTNNCETFEAFETHQQKALTMGDPSSNATTTPPGAVTGVQSYGWPSSGVVTILRCLMVFVPATQWSRNMIFSRIIPKHIVLVLLWPGLWWLTKFEPFPVIIGDRTDGHLVLLRWDWIMGAVISILIDSGPHHSHAQGSGDDGGDDGGGDGGGGVVSLWL